MCRAHERATMTRQPRHLELPHLAGADPTASIELGGALRTPTAPDEPFILRAVPLPPLVRRLARVKATGEPVDHPTVAVDDPAMVVLFVRFAGTRPGPLMR